MVHPVARSGRGLDLGAVLEVAAGLGIRSILCEGGGRLVSSFLAEGLAGRVYVVHAPRVLGPDGVPGFPGPFPPGMWEAWRPAFEPERLGRDVLTVYEREP
jgi:diaminohydroxyphosphoribosylaminopyrimidine deaminase/5-amino-6-(5-phosphoribosylamino)uracil reductase